MDIAQQIACVRREIAMRRNVYPKFIQSGRMKKVDADYELECMQAVLVTLSINYPVAIRRIEKLEQELATKDNPDEQ